MAETGEKRANCFQARAPMCNSASEKGSASGEAQGLMKEGQAVYPFKIYGKLSTDTSGLYFPFQTSLFDLCIFLE